MNDIKALCHAPNVPGLIRFYGAYHAADRGQIAVVLEYMDGGSLADVLAKVRGAGRPEGRGCIADATVGRHGAELACTGAALHHLCVEVCLEKGAAAAGAAWPRRPAGLC